MSRSLFAVVFLTVAVISVQGQSAPDGTKNAVEPSAGRAVEDIPVGQGFRSVRVWRKDVFARRRS